MGWDQRGQEDASFLITIACMKYLFDASQGILDELGRILRRYGEWDRHAIGVLGLIVKRFVITKTVTTPAARWRRRTFSAARVIYVATAARILVRVVMGRPKEMLSPRNGQDEKTALSFRDGEISGEVLGLPGGWTRCPSSALSG